jgi:predicted RNase H-like nuclease (RuvC/YqgF family)
MDAESLAQVERIVTTAASGVEGRLRDEMQALREDLGEKIVAAERHAGALFEEALHRIDLVFEGHQALNQKIERVETKIEKLERKMEHEFLEMRALIQLSYRQLQERVETLEQRVQFIEKRLGLSA